MKLLQESLGWLVVLVTAMGLFWLRSTPICPIEPCYETLSASRHNGLSHRTLLWDSFGFPAPRFVPLSLAMRLSRLRCTPICPIEPRYGTLSASLYPDLSHRTSLCDSFGFPAPPICPIEPRYGTLSASRRPGFSHRTHLWDIFT